MTTGILQRSGGRTDKETNPILLRQRILGLLCAAPHGLTTHTIITLACWTDLGGVPDVKPTVVERRLHGFRRAGIIVCDDGVWFATREAHRVLDGFATTPAGISRTPRNQGLGPKARRCIHILQTLTRSGPATFEQVKGEADRAGTSMATMYKAARSIDITIHVQPGSLGHGRLWCPPGHTPQGPTDSLITQKATDHLQTILKDGPVDSQTVRDRMQAAGFPEATTYRVRRSMGVVSVWTQPEGGGYPRSSWTLPQDGAEAVAA